MMLIPKPTRYQETPGEFQLGPNQALQADAASGDTKRFLMTALSAGGSFSCTEAPAAGAATIQIREDASLRHLGREGYQLSITPQTIAISAATAAGRFYAVQTLLQLLPPEIFSQTPHSRKTALIPCVEIEDHPRFAWRGLMLDTARHWCSVSDLKRLLDHMAAHKLNVFHWHLVDDQGWRLEIKRYPRLVEVGSKRPESPLPGNRKTGDGKPYAAFYTQAEAREIVAYAAARHITVVPEIEMPGHAGAALAAYPEMGNSDLPGYRPQVETRWGIHPSIYAPADLTFDFLESILSEVMEIFPGKYIHVGGDEAPKDQWIKSPAAQAVMKKQGLKSEEALQSWFLRRIERFLQSKGRRMIGWDEIQEGGLSADATMMVWRDWKWARLAIEAGNDIVMSPQTHCYLDYYQGSAETEPEAISGELTLEKTYEFEPAYAGITPKGESQILGLQGNVWTEYIRDTPQRDYMIWPRACALAEVAWSAREGRSWPEFQPRLRHHTKRLSALGISFRPLD